MNATIVDKMPPLEDSIHFYVIYERPSDYPGGFVMRGHAVLKDGSHVVRREPVAWSQDYESVAMYIPNGTVCIPRSEGDDPCIKESWML